jgi:hypothetical protein
MAILATDSHFKKRRVLSVAIYGLIFKRNRRLVFLLEVYPWDNFIPYDLVKLYNIRIVDVMKASKITGHGETRHLLDPVKESRHAPWQSCIISMIGYLTHQWMKSKFSPAPVTNRKSPSRTRLGVKIVNVFLSELSHPWKPRGCLSTGTNKLRERDFFFFYTYASTLFKSSTWTEAKRKRLDPVGSKTKSWTRLRLRDNGF